jgi:hypothetical protein
MARKSKLEDITGENHKLFVRINMQQSHYPSATATPSQEKAAIKFNSIIDGRLGPIGSWDPPTCFIFGSRGIMCDHNLGVANMPSAKSDKVRLPSLKRMATPEK